MLSTWGLIRRVCLGTTNSHNVLVPASVRFSTSGARSAWTSVAPVRRLQRTAVLITLFPAAAVTCRVKLLRARLGRPPLWPCLSPASLFSPPSPKFSAVCFEESLVRWSPGHLTTFACRLQEVRPGRRTGVANQELGTGRENTRGCSPGPLWWRWTLALSPDSRSIFNGSHLLHPCRTPARHTGK